jgi:hypothetical protein
LIGHSNMAGDDPFNSDGVTHPHAWNYLWASTKAWVPAKEPPGTGSGFSTRGAGGPGMPFLKGMIAAYPEYYFGVVCNASYSATCRGVNAGGNSSGLDPSDNRYWKGTYLYEQIVASAKEIQKDATLGGILCMLGTIEATRTNKDVCNNFSNDVSQMIKDMRTDLGTPNLPFVMGEYEAEATGDAAITLPLPAIVQSEIKLIPSKLSMSATVDSRGIPTIVGFHYPSTPQGQGEWAKRAIGVIQANKFFPPGATPSLVEAHAILRPAAAAPKLMIEDGEKLILKSDELYLMNGAKAAATFRIR